MCYHASLQKHHGLSERNFRVFEASCFRYKNHGNPVEFAQAIRVTPGVFRAVFDHRPRA